MRGLVSLVQPSQMLSANGKYGESAGQGLRIDDSAILPLPGWISDAWRMGIQFRGGRCPANGDASSDCKRLLRIVCANWSNTKKVARRGSWCKRVTQETYTVCLKTIEMTFLKSSPRCERPFPKSTSFVGIDLSSKLLAK